MSCYFTNGPENQLSVSVLVSLSNAKISYAKYKEGEDKDFCNSWLARGESFYL
jgi:hypothetical protein